MVTEVYIAIYSLGNHQQYICVAFLFDLSKYNFVTWTDKLPDDQNTVKERKKSFFQIQEEQYSNLNSELKSLWMIKLIPFFHFIFHGLKVVNKLKIQCIKTNEDHIYVGVSLVGIKIQQDKVVLIKKLSLCSAIIIII